MYQSANHACTVIAHSSGYATNELSVAADLQEGVVQACMGQYIAVYVAVAVASGAGGAGVAGCAGGAGGAAGSGVLVVLVVIAVMVVMRTLGAAAHNGYCNQLFVFNLLRESMLVSSSLYLF